MKKIHWWTILNYRENSIAEKIAQLILNNDFEFVNEDNYETIIKNDKYEIRFWNAGKYHSWFSRGNIKKDDKIIYWNNGRPSIKTMNKLINKIDEIRLSVINNFIERK